MSEEHPILDPPETRRCAICGETAAYGFGPPGAPMQPSDAWYCGAHRQEGEGRWATRYQRPTSAGA